MQNPKIDLFSTLTFGDGNIEQKVECW